MVQYGKIQTYCFPPVVVVELEDAKNKGLNHDEASEDNEPLGLATDVGRNTVNNSISGDHLNQWR